MSTPTVRKIRFMYWEADVESGNVIYSFPAYTKAGALKKANKFLEEHA